MVPLFERVKMTTIEYGHFVSSSENNISRTWSSKISQITILIFAYYQAINYLHFTLQLIFYGNLIFLCNLTICNLSKIWGQTKVWVFSLRNYKISKIYCFCFNLGYILNETINHNNLWHKSYKRINLVFIYVSQHGNKYNN